MNDPLLMSGVERCRNLSGNGDRFVNRNWSTGDAFVDEIRAFCYSMPVTCTTPLAWTPSCRGGPWPSRDPEKFVRT